MIRTARRALLSAGALAVTVSLTGCGTFANNDAAATINGQEVSRDYFERIVNALVAEELPGAVPDEATGTVEAGNLRNVLSALVVQRGIQDFLATNGEPVTDADRQAALDSLPDADQLEQMDAELADVVVAQAAVRSALSRVAAPEASELQRRYEEDPSSLGIMCVRHILSESEAEADDVLAELEAGTDFAGLAAERSIDPTAAENGGRLEGATGSCQSIVQAEQLIDGDFLAGAVGAVPGRFVGPVRSTFGWHVIEALPFADAQTSIDGLFATEAGPILLDAYLKSADVTVDPRYGVWDPAALTVVAL